MKDIFNKQICVNDNVIFSTRGTCNYSHLSLGVVTKVTDRHLMILVLKSSSFAFRNGLRKIVYFKNENDEYDSKIVVKRKPNMPYKTRILRSDNIVVVPMNMVNV